jgi:hypothetical protein
MKALILYDEQGKIIAVSRVVDPQAHGSKFTSYGMIPRAGQKVLEIELDKDLESKPLREFHEHHQVDVARSKLARKPQSGL